MAKIENNTRAACFLAIRERNPRLPAFRAWHQAALRMETIQARQREVEAAGARLAALWQACGKVEPKRYSPEGVALYDARRAASLATSNLSAVAAYVMSHPARPYAGTWQPSNPGQYYMETPESAFRVIAAHDVPSARIEHTGHYTNSDGESFLGEGLIWGVVAQLAGRDGKARFVAGYQFGQETGATLDLSRIFESHGEDSQSARIDAALAADRLAEIAAERERDYQAGSNAGDSWLDCLEQAKAIRAELLAMLAERRAAIRGPMAGQFPALCRALESKARELLADRAELRAKAEQFADSVRYNTAARVAFCEGAGIPLARFPR